MAAVTATSAQGWPNGVPITYTAPDAAPLGGTVLVTATVGVSAPVTKPKPQPAAEEETVTPAIDPAKLADNAILRVQDARNRTNSTNNLKQIALALHNYADANRGKLPGDVLDKTGKPLLSWRVLLLPYLEQNDLYKQFKLDEPWDSKNNRPLLEKMPKVQIYVMGKNVWRGEGGYGPSATASINADHSRSDYIVISDAQLLFTSEFHRAGPDLILTGHDGRNHIIPNYFASENRPALTAPNGASLPAALVDLLAGSPTPNEYAQAQPTAGAEPIGVGDGSIDQI